MADERRRGSDSSEDEQNAWEKFVQPIFAEFIGTALYTFLACMAVTGSGIFGIGIAHGFAMAALCTGFIEISGGQFNPAVSLASVLAGGTHPIVGLIYIPIQIVAGLVGSAFVKAVLQEDTYNEFDGGAPMLRGNRRITPFDEYDKVNRWEFSVVSAIIIEILVCTLIYLSYLMSNVDTRTGVKDPIYYGFGVSAGVLASYYVSGGAFNPAVSFGAAIVSGYWPNHYVYWAGPVVGALISAALYRLLLGDRKKRLLFKG
ncbi:LOW QUALITY PROTEIN: aquaporin-8-like [Amphiura filiformis]|uniref:LOW QUALITY PROTEIN: aquaporin-8-like n=1 Tax=Amphiura filiformis TaxID=82378 RepID=UPI003B2143BF